MAHAQRPQPVSEPRAGGISLYVLPIAPITSAQLLAGGVVPCGDYVCNLRTIDGWRFYHLWQPPERDTPAPLMPVADLRTQAHELHAAAMALVGGAWSYTILHIPTLVVPPEGKSAEQNEKQRLQTKIATRQLLDDLDPRRPGEPRGYFVQFDTDLHRKGYLAVGGRAAVLLGLSDESFATLASLLQAGTLDARGGFTPEGLSNAMVRVSLWSANQDIHESVEEIRILRRSGDDSTRGQIGISFALAFIGVALAFVPYLNDSIFLAPGLALLACSGLVYAFHAQRGGWTRWVALVLLLIGIILLISGTAASLLGLTLPAIQVPSSPASPPIR
jgi:hypothetical protein